MSNDLALAVEIQVEAQKAVEQINKIKDAVKGMGDVFQTAGGAGSSAGDSIFAGMLKAQLAMEGIRMALGAVAGAFKDVLGAGIQFNAAMSQSALGIGTLVAAMSTLKDANGTVLTGQQALNAGMELGAKQVNELRIGSFQTVATVRQLTDAYQQGLGPMLAAGVGLEDTTKLTVKFAQAAGALGLDMTTLGHEMRATFSGQISPRITKIASALQIKKEDIDAWKEAGTLVENLNAKFEFFGLAGAKVEESWKGITSNLEHAFEAGSGEMTKPLFDALRIGLHDALGDAFNLSTGDFSYKFSGILDAGRDIFGKLGEIAADGIRLAVDAMEAFATWLKENRDQIMGFIDAATAMAKMVGETLAGAFKVLGVIITIFMQTIGRFPEIVAAVVMGMAGMAVVNGVAAISWGAVTAGIGSATMAVIAFWAAVGPLGWIVGGVAAVCAAFMAMSEASARSTKEELAHAAALHKSNEEATGLVERLTILEAKLQSGTLTLGAKIAAEKEAREILVKLQESGAEYLKGMDLQHTSLATLIRLTENATNAQQQKEAADKAATIAALAQAQAQLVQAEAYMKSQGHTKDSKELWIWTPEDVGAVRNLQEEITKLQGKVAAYGGEEKTANLTLAQKKERLSEITVELKRLGDIQLAALNGVGDAAATAAFEKRKVEIAALTKEQEGLRKDTGITSSAKPQHEKPDGKSPELLRLEQEAFLLGEKVKGMAHVTLAEQEELAVQKEKLDALREMVKIQADEDKHDDGTGKKVGGITASAATERRNAVTTAEGNAEANTRKEFDAKTLKAKADLEASMTSMEEGGLATRLKAIEKSFENIRTLNKALGGNIVTEERIQGAQGAAEDRARADQLQADIGRLKKELAELTKAAGGPLTDGETAAAIEQFALKNKDAAQAVAEVRAELHLGQTAAQGFDAGLRASLSQGGNPFILMRNFAQSAISGVTNGFATMFASILTQGGSFGDKMKALWKGVSTAVVQALAQMAAQYLVNKAIESAMSTAWGIQAAAKLGLNTKDAASSKLTATTVVDGEAAKTKAISATGLAATTAGGAQTAAFASVGTAAGISATAVSSAAVDMVIAYMGITKAAMIAGAAEAWEAYGGIPIYGAIAAAAQIVAMNMSVAAEAALPAYAQGGRVDRATIGLMGEAGPEIIAPESSFHDYTKTMFAMGANLAANLNQNTQQTQDYRGASAGYGAQVASTSSSGSGGRGGGIYVNLSGSFIAGESAESSRQIGNMIKKHLDLFNKRAG